MSEIKFFVRSVTGIPAHLTLSEDTSPEHLITLLNNMNTALGWLANNQFEGHWGGEGRGGGGLQVQEEGPACSECDEKMTYREGPKRDGSGTYRGWFCSNRDHPPMWVNSKEEWKEK